ncbi:MAG: hypothetical protein HYY24_26360 [Verrucomicrobia bacterium]|nr:hypothetical protein [Verrucomicrobiota bacterium]
MNTLESLESQIGALPRAEVEALQDRLSRLLEDEAELNPDFVESIERGNADLRAGRVRTRTPEEA